MKPTPTSDEQPGHESRPQSDPEPGNGIVRAAWIATAALAVTGAAAVATDDPAVRAAAAATSLGLFAAGVVVFFWAYAIAVSRSRTDEIGIGGLFFLAGEGTAPKRPTTHLRAALAAQIAIALAAAAARPFTSLAFGVLAPMSALALTGLYGARHGSYPERSR